MSTPQTPPAGKAPIRSDFSWDPLVVEKFPNGLTLIIKENHTAPLVITDAWFRVGSRNENDLNNGVAHFLEHTLFKGTKSRGIGQVAKDIETFGGSTNAGTSMDFTHYYISCESRHIDKALEIHADVFRSSTLLEEAIDKERGVILEEIKRGEDNPQKVVWDTFVSTIFSSHPYHRLTLGPRENIAKNISREEMVQFFQTWYVPSNMYLIVAGDVEPQGIIAKVRELYADLPPGKVPAASFEAEPPLTEPVVVRKEMDVLRSYLMMGFRTIPQARAEESLGLDLLGVILGQGRTSRLSMALKENRGLVTQIGAGQISLLDDGLFLIRTEYDPLDEEEVLKGIREEIRKVVEIPVAPEELQKAKDYLENLYIRAVESNEGKADALGSSAVKADLDFEREYLNRMKGISAEYVQRLAKEFLGSHATVSVIVGPKASCTLAAEEAGTRKFQFDNGLRLVHREIKDTGLIGVSLAIDAGNRREPAERSGISHLTSEMLLKGTRRRDGKKILWDLESIGASMHPSAEPDLLRFNLSVSRRHFHKAMEIFGDVIRNPTFPEEAFTVERSKVLMRLQAASDDMFENTWRLFNGKLFPNHPYGCYSLGSRETVEALTTRALADYYETCFKPANMTLAIVGDLSDSEATKAASLLFGSMQPAPGWAPEANPGLPRKPEGIVLAADKKKKAQAMICLGWLGPVLSHSDFFPMKVLNSILGGGMSARYFMNIRNKASLAYAVQSVFPSRLDGGALCAIIGTSPDKADQARDLVLKEIQDIIDHPVGQEELDRAISYITGQFALEHGTCLKYAHYLSWFENIGVGFRFDSQFIRKIQGVTREDIQRVASTYLSAQNYVQAVTGP